MRSGRSLPTMRSGRHSPTMRSGRRSPTMRSGRWLPTMRSGRYLPTMRSGRDLSTMRSGRWLPTMRSGRSLPATRSGRSLPTTRCGRPANDALRQALASAGVPAGDGQRGVPAGARQRSHAAGSQLARRGPAKRTRAPARSKPRPRDNSDSQLPRQALERPGGWEFWRSALLSPHLSMPGSLRRFHLRPISCTLTTALLCLVLAEYAQAQLATVETPQVRLVYFDGSESYLVPHAARAFLNALEFEEDLFDFKPTDRITLLLADFSDAGNAAAGAVPRNVMAIQIAPLNFAFETIAANERMTTLMNHELVHVVTMDQAGRTRSRLPAAVRRQGRAGRRASRVAPLLVPHRAARRRAAVVSRGHRGVRRHLDGRRPGPRAGRLRRDGLPRDGRATTCRSTIRSASCRKARKIDFQVAGELVPVRHAVHDVAGAPLLAREADRVGLARRRAAAATTPRSSSRCSACRSSRRGRTGSRTSTSSSGRTSRRSASIRSRRTRDVTTRAARIGVARVLRSERPDAIYAGAQLSRRGRRTWRDLGEDRRDRAAAWTSRGR